jgi:hypothetical protein
MKSTFIYMNQNIKDKANRKRKVPEPAIAIQRGKSLIYANEVTICDSNGTYVGTVKVSFKGNRKIKTHDAVAWIELHDDCVVYPER